MDIIFLTRPLIEELHRMQIERFGGAYGLRDGGMLKSALTRAINKASYGCDDIFELAAAYLFGLVKNHAFVDGNKRIGIVTAAVFLMENGFEIATSDVNLYTLVLNIASGEIDEDGATRFLRDVSVPVTS